MTLIVLIELRLTVVYLNVLHSASGTAQKATDWNLDKLLKAIY